jgi:hypothetical protein
MTGATMTTATRATKQLIKTYKSLRVAEALTQAKLDALLETNALYKLFENENDHPYHSLVGAAKNAVIVFETLVGGVRDWQIGSSSIAEELDKLKAKQIVDDADADADLDELRLIESEIKTEEDAAGTVLSLVLNTIFLLSYSEDGFIKQYLSERYGKKNVAKHKESPEIKTTKECRTAVKEMKKLATELMGCGNGSGTIRSEIEKRQLEQVASGKNRVDWIDKLMKV